MSDPIMGFVGGVIFTQRTVNEEQLKLLTELTKRGDAPEWFGLRKTDDGFLICLDEDFGFDWDEEKEEWMVSS